MTQIRKATLADTTAILRAYIDSTRLMLSQGILQWHYNYPNIHNIEKDISNGISYVIQHDDNVGVIIIDTHQDEQYARLQWPYQSQKSVVIHRLAVHPRLQGRGYGKRLCQYAEIVARDFHCDSVRLDAYSTNIGSNQLYIRLGYKKAKGYCYYHHNPEPFICFEKKIAYEL